MSTASTASAAHLTVEIDCAPALVVRVVRDPALLPRWAAGLCHAVTVVDGDWIVHTDAGEAVMRFVQSAESGVLDHVVRLPSGEQVAVPMRVTADAGGSLVTLSVLPRPDMSETAFAADCAAVQHDLLALKALIESERLSKLRADE